MDIFDLNEPFDPKAFHTFEYMQVHIANIIIKIAVLSFCITAAYYFKMSLPQGLTITFVALLLESVLYRKIFIWKRTSSSSYAVNEFIAYIVGLTVWGITDLVLYVFDHYSLTIRILSLCIILAVAFTYKTIQLHKELDYVSPFYHHELSGRIISGSIYSSIILSFGLLLGNLLSVRAVLYISCGSALIIFPIYIFLVRPHHDTLIKNESILYGIPIIEKIHFKKILRDYLKKQKLSDLEYSVLDEYPELLAKYFHIQFVLNECLSVFLSDKYDRKYLRSILNDLNELSSFYEKLRETTENYVKQKRDEEEAENRRREEQTYTNQKNSGDNGRYQNEQHLQFFKNVKNIDELNREFRKLVKKFHPDSTHGSQEKFVALKSEYDMLKTRFTTG